MTHPEVEHSLAEKIENPAWDYIKVIPNDDLFARGTRFTPATYTPNRPSEWRKSPPVPHRARVTSEWTWAIPDPQALGFIVNVLDGRSVVELGAGNGYWAWLLRQCGVDVNAYDAHPIGHPDSWFDGNQWRENLKHYGLEVAKPKEWFPVEQGSHEVLALPTNSTRVLFLCWPDFDTPFAYDTTEAFQGDTIIYIGEGPGGCNGDAAFHKLAFDSCSHWGAEECTCNDIANEWEEVGHFPLPQWSGLHDDVYVFTRKDTA